MNKKRRKLENCLFVFNTQDDFQNFWNNIINNLEDTDVIDNTFAVLNDDGWRKKLLKWFIKRL